jgi:hypothetical protein
MPSKHFCYFCPVNTFMPDQHSSVTIALGYPRCCNSALRSATSCLSIRDIPKHSPQSRDNKPQPARATIEPPSGG